MKTTIILTFAALALTFAIEPRACTVEGCLATTGAVPLPTLSADCSSFMVVRITPPVRTLTSTTFIKPTPTAPTLPPPPPSLLPRQTSLPSSIPPYASACQNAPAYASACSCLGITQRTTTVRAPRTTVVVTALATACASMAVAEVPVCAHSCLRELAPSYNCTGLEDLGCQCKNFEDIAEKVTPCVREGCSRAEFERVYPAAEKGCACFAVGGA